MYGWGEKENVTTSEDYSILLESPGSYEGRRRWWLELMRRGKAKIISLLCSNWHLNRVGHAALGGVYFYEERTKGPGNLIC